MSLLFFQTRRAFAVTVLLAVLSLSKGRRRFSPKPKLACDAIEVAFTTAPLSVLTLPDIVPAAAAIASFTGANGTAATSAPQDWTAQRSLGNPIWITDERDETVQKNQGLFAAMGADELNGRRASDRQGKSGTPEGLRPAEASLILPPKKALLRAQQQRLNHGERREGPAYTQEEHQMRPVGEGTEEIRVPTRKRQHSTRLPGNPTGGILEQQDGGCPHAQPQPPAVNNSNVVSSSNLHGGEHLQQPSSLPVPSHDCKQRKTVTPRFSWCPWLEMLWEMNNVFPEEHCEERCAGRESQTAPSSSATNATPVQGKEASAAQTEHQTRNPEPKRARHPSTNQLPENTLSSRNVHRGTSTDRLWSSKRQRATGGPRHTRQSKRRPNNAPTESELNPQGTEPGLATGGPRHTRQSKRCPNNAPTVSELNPQGTEPGLATGGPRHTRQSKRRPNNAPTVSELNPQGTEPGLASTQVSRVSVIRYASAGIEGYSEGEGQQGTMVPVPSLLRHASEEFRPYGDVQAQSVQLASSAAVRYSYDGILGQAPAFNHSFVQLPIDGAIPAVLLPQGSSITDTLFQPGFRRDDSLVPLQAAVIHSSHVHESLYSNQHGFNNDHTYFALPQGTPNPSSALYEPLPYTAVPQWTQSHQSLVYEPYVRVDITQNNPYLVAPQEILGPSSGVNEPLQWARTT